MRHSAGHLQDVAAIAKSVAVVDTHECAAVAQLGMDDTLQELVMTTSRYWMMARPLSLAPASLALLVLDPRRANVVLARVELETFVQSVEGPAEGCVG